MYIDRNSLLSIAWDSILDHTSDFAAIVVLK